MQLDGSDNTNIQPGLVLGGKVSLKALGGTADRDYSYDVFWVVFPLVDNDGEPLLSDTTKEAELIVRIYGKEGRVDWKIPASIRDRAHAIAEPREH